MYIGVSFTTSFFTHFRSIYEYKEKRQGVRVEDTKHVLYCTLTNATPPKHKL